MKIFTPRWRYQAVSLTGTWCALRCSYCDGRYLRGMIHVTPGDIEEKIQGLWLNGVRGVLISGGFNKEGRLPVEPYLDKLVEIKKRTGLFMSIHLGLLRDRDLLQRVAEFADLVDYELLWNQNIIGSVKNLDTTRETFKKTMELAIDSGLEIVPHIYAWHPWITIDELREEINYLNEIGVDRTIMLIYIPPGGSIVNQEQERVIEYIRFIRARLNGKLYMGCMRPWSVKKAIDRVLIEENLVDRIVNPYLGASQQSSVELYDACCSVPDSRLEEFRVG